MSSTVLMPSHRPSLTGFLLAMFESIAAVLAAAYSRSDDIEPFGL